MFSDESAALLNQVIDLSCEVEATRSGYRRLAYIWQLPDRFQTPDVTQFAVGCFELPIAVVEAEARGELVDQVDTHVDAQHSVASGSSRTLSWSTPKLRTENRLTFLFQQFKFNEGGTNLKLQFISVDPTT